MIRHALCLARRHALGGASVAALGGAQWASGVVRCDTPSSFPSMPSMPSMPSSFGDILPTGQAAGFGGMVGFCAGYALKKVGKASVVVAGFFFLLQQSLAYTEYVTMNWDKVEQDVTKLLDTNGDGKLDEQDVNAWSHRGFAIISANTGALGGSFGGGFLLGARKG
uniref:EF-hand domain-containing protein n=1 Tax=Noctiluca scintillans TaxID=2966 RepID=A0A7S1B2Y7_NOCSC|mmetsp:Transcript_9980/g.27932  ORF Transcript_9980/g.27932 Transcript_9980/m.27932 type:complete len:166 (+) Transcript_9980:48-545(+)